MADSMRNRSTTVDGVRTSDRSTRKVWTDPRGCRRTLFRTPRQLHQLLDQGTEPATVIHVSQVPAGAPVEVTDLDGQLLFSGHLTCHLNGRLARRHFDETLAGLGSRPVPEAANLLACAAEIGLAGGASTAAAHRLTWVLSELCQMAERAQLTDWATSTLLSAVRRDPAAAGEVLAAAGVAATEDLGKLWWALGTPDEFTGLLTGTDTAPVAVATLVAVTSTWAHVAPLTEHPDPQVRALTLLHPAAATELDRTVTAGTDPELLVALADARGVAERLCAQAPGTVSFAAGLCALTVRDPQSALACLPTNPHLTATFGDLARRGHVTQALVEAASCAAGAPDQLHELTQLLAAVVEHFTDGRESVVTDALTTPNRYRSLRAALVPAAP